MPKLRIPITKKVREEIIAFLPQLRAQGLTISSIEFTETGFKILSSGAALDADDKAVLDEAQRKWEEAAIAKARIPRAVRRSRR